MSSLVSLSRWALGPVLLILAWGCATTNTAAIKEKLAQADQVRQEATLSPQAAAAEDEIRSSQELGDAAADKIGRLEAKDREIPPAERYNLEVKARTEAEESLRLAAEALQKVRLAQSQAGPAPTEKPGESPGTGPPAEPKAGAEPQGLPQDPDQLYRLGLGQYFAGAYPKARQSLVAFLEAYPDHPLAVNAQYWIGETYFAQKQWVLALGAFQAVLDHYPKGRKVPDALLKIGLTEANLGRFKRARAALRECLSRFPKSEPAALARQVLERL